MSALGILGTGLLGASIGMRARRAGGFVLGYDPDEEAARVALERGALDERGTRDDVFARCSTIVVAAPLFAACEELQAMRLREARWELAIDIASVKRPVVEAAAGLRNFVATHPMAGNEGSGPLAARLDMFEGRTWAYVPSTDPELDARAAAFIASLGARPFAVEAAVHDAAVALTSHVPQVLAWLFAERIRAGGELYDRLCGPAAREMLRLAASPHELWSEILSANGDNVSSVSCDVAQALARERKLAH